MLCRPPRRHRPADRAQPLHPLAGLAQRHRHQMFGAAVDGQRQKDREGDKTEGQRQAGPRETRRNAAENSGQEARPQRTASTGAFEGGFLACHGARIRRHGRAPAGPVYALGHQFLARAALARDQHRHRLRSRTALAVADHVGDVDDLRLSDRHVVEGRARREPERAVGVDGDGPVHALRQGRGLDGQRIAVDIAVIEKRAESNRAVFVGDRDIVERAAEVVRDVTHLTEYYVSDINGQNERRLTSFNDALQKEVAFSDAERIVYKSVDNLEIEGWLMKPYGYQPGKKYPVVLYIHGGPHSQYNEGWFDEFQSLAGGGVFVLYTNPRGSSGTNNTFTNASRGTRYFVA